jgi:UMF1 family MFS transporter
VQKEVNKTLSLQLAAYQSYNAATIDGYRQAISRSTIMFWSMAILVGTVQGGIQAVSRSYFGKLVPKERSNEFFGFFDIFGKFATFMGPLLYALIGTATGRSSFGTLALLSLFLIGFIILVFAKKPLQELERQRVTEGN